MDDLPGNVLGVLMESPPSSAYSSTSSSSSEDSSYLSSSTEENVLTPHSSIHRITEYVSRTVASYNIVEFQQHFRLHRSTFDVMEGIITVANVLPQYPFGQRQVTHKEGLLMAIWYLANNETFRQISDRFGVCMDTVRNVIKKIMIYFISQSETYIKWPSQELSRENEQAFYQKSGIHGAIGAVDGSHIRITRPNKDQESYCNRKGYHSMVLQGVCDHKKKFIEVFFGEPGSQHDARVLRKSNIFKRAEDGILNMGEYFLLGDSAYPCVNWLIPPFKDDGNLTNNHRAFNYRHSSARVVIEHAFGLLKSRFRRLLHGFENQDKKFIVICVLCACIFHNICINHNDTTTEDIQMEEIDIDQEPLPMIGIFQNDNQGRNKRNIIFENMFPRNA